MATGDFLAELHIKSLVVRERYYRDTSQWEKLRAAWHPELSKTWVNISWYQGNVGGFINGSQRMSKGTTNSMHTICPVEVYINGDKALSESTGSIVMRFPHEGTDFECVSYARFISRLERVNESWKLVSLEAIYDRDSIVPVIPSARPVVLSIDEKGSRKSYKCLTWILAQGGFKVRTDLPGTDIPESATAVMNHGFAWLKG